MNEFKSNNQELQGNVHQVFIEKFQVPEVAYGVIDRMFTPEEIDFVSRIETERFQLEEMKALGVSNPEQFAESAYRRGVISLADGAAKVYRISDFYSRLDIFSITEVERYHEIPEQERLGLDEWYFETYYQSLSQDPKQAPTEDEILPLDEVLAFIDRQNRPVYLNLCDCRSLRGGCDQPVKTCITYKDGVNSFAHRGLSEKIDKDLAKKVVMEADKAGLVHTINPNGICNCCGDCCYLFRGQKKRNSIGLWPKSSYLIELDHTKCIGCGKCIRRCSFSVFSFESAAENIEPISEKTEPISEKTNPIKKQKTLRLDTSACIGCGICVTGCPAAALTLKGR